MVSIFGLMLMTIITTSLSLCNSTPIENVTFSGDAHLRNNVIFLTEEPEKCGSNSSRSSGAALYGKPIRFLDSNSTAGSFWSRFSLSVVPTPFCPSPDGLAFFISESFPRSSNGHLGLPEPGSNFTFLAVEFDTSFDPMFGDINDNHVGLDLNSGFRSLSSVDLGLSSIFLKDGRRLNAWIDYNHHSKLIQIDLSNYFKEWMYVGFSASNGLGSAHYIIDHWHFTTTTHHNPNPNGDCFLCEYHQPSDDFIPSKNKVVHITLLFSALALFIICSILALLSFVSYLVIKKNRGSRVRYVEPPTFHVEMLRDPMRLSLQEIKLATMDFDVNRILGKGASATVYRGSLSFGWEVAVKRFHRPTAANHLMTNPFTTEFSTMAIYLQHKNLVKLHGWCYEADELVLVYEFLHQGSLAKLLHNNSNSQSPLPWNYRLSIVLGVSSALTYLHEQCESQIIHRDVKTSNILLDAEYNAKLGDFGLAKVYTHSSVTRQPTIPAGTMGYRAPEYIYTGVPTVKTDVYSFGVVLLEVASGKRVVNEDGTMLVDWIWDLWEAGKVMEARDTSLMGNYVGVEMERMLRVGLICVHPNHERRPTVKEAATILKGEGPLPLLPSNRPKVCIVPVVSDKSSDFDIEKAYRDDPGPDEQAWMTPDSCFD